MSIELIVTIFIIGLIGAFISGLLGIGGSVINYPMLLYVIPLVGLNPLTSHEITGIVAVQVLFSTFSGVIAYRKSEFLEKDIVTYMGISVLTGSMIGGYVSSFFDQSIVNLVFAILATIASVMMVLPQKGNETVEYEEEDFNKKLASIIAFIVGIFSGIVGAGGAFILVPFMLVVLKIPLKVTIANSLAITFISAIGTAGTKILTGQVLLVPAIVIVGASLIAAPLGAKIGKASNPKVLKPLLALLIFLSAIKIWSDII
ncbi:MAG: sulfite exporter TauE/SafE family protein [Peptostreptococcaceae bacterium]